MGFTFEASQKNSDAPNLEGGMYDARFSGLEKKHITGGKFGDGDRLEWAFGLLDDDGEPLQDTDAEGNVKYKDGDVVEIEATGLTSLSMNTKSQTQPRGVRYLKALATPEEFADFVKYGETGGAEGAPIDADELLNRPCQVEVRIKDSGWPEIVNVLPARSRRATRRRTSPEGEE
jgi:hypothetical protein